MESLSSENKSIALDILEDILSAHHYFDVDASQILWILQNEISPLKKAILYFIKELK
jgi:uncharacterized protein with HEPN domain